MLEASNEQVLANGIPRMSQYRIVRDDGRVLWVDARAEQEFDEAGDVVAIVGFAQDVTEYKRVVDGLRDSEDKFRYTFDHSPVAKSITRPTGEIEVNDAFLDMLGYTREEMADRGTWQQITHPDDVALSERTTASIIAGERPFARWEKRYVRKDGIVVWGDVSTGLRRCADGSPDYFVTTVVDITHIKATEARLLRGVRALRTLSASNGLLLRSEDADQLFQGVCDIAVEQGSYRMAWVGIAEHDDMKSIRPLAQAGWESGFLDQIPHSWGEGSNDLSSRAIRERRTTLARSPEEADHVEPFPGAIATRGYRSSAALPLLDPAGEAFGVFVLAAAEPDAFDADEVTLLEELASDVSFGIATLDSAKRRLEAEKDLVTSKERLESLLKCLTETLGRVVETRDPYTKGHEERVAVLSRMMAVEMDLSQAEADGIEAAALVHDIGKLSIPAEILTRPGALTDLEFSLIQDHARSGFAILKDIPFGWPVAEMVLQHHERMDGSGYPGGLTGDEILMGARVLAVADVVEAMSSHRPYRPALGLDRAIAEISGGSGKYDPDVVRTCVRLFEAGRIDL
jgi:PAS domain S-box-containing protein